MARPPGWLLRRGLTRHYEHALVELFDEARWLGVDRSPHWPMQHHADYVASRAARVLALNSRLRSITRPRHHPGLVAEARWARKLQRRARRLSGGPDNGGDGLAGVREPRRPSPDRGGAVAALTPPRSPAGAGQDDLGDGGSASSSG